MFIEVYSHFIRNENDTKETLDRRSALLDWFLSVYPVEEFKGQDAIIYYLLKYVNALDLNLSLRAIDSFSAVELKGVLIKNKIKTPATTGLNYEDVGQLLSAVEAVKLSLKDEIQKAYELNKTKNILDFKLDVDIYRATKLQDRIYDLYNEGSIIMESMSDKKTDSDEVLAYTLNKIYDLQEIYGKEKLLELEKWVANVDDEQFKFCFDWGIGPLDQLTGGAFTTELISIEAPPGVGKTKFVISQVAWRAAVLYKKNVLLFSLEQVDKEIISIMVARHYFYLYREVFDEANYRKSEEFIKLPPEIQQKFLAAKDDLFNSRLYGNINIQCVTLFEDTFISKIKRHNRLECFYDVVIIDYIGLIRPSKTSKFKFKSFEIIADSLTAFKGFARETKSVAVAVNQLGSEGIKNAKDGKSGSETGAQGGLTVYRSTDKNIIISATATQKLQDIRAIELSKARGAPRLINFLAKVKLCMGLFVHDAKDFSKTG